MREIDREHNWFWQQGYHDGLDGQRAIAPDETRHSFQRSDYIAGFDAGSEDRAAKQDSVAIERETRFVNCNVCGTEGVIERGHPNAPDPTSVEICPACHGELVIEVDVEPITEEESS
jgi:hypothetical protein